MSSAWPGVPDGFASSDEMKKYRAEKILEAEVELEKGRRATTAPAPPADPTDTMSFALEQKMHETLYTVATGSIDRARTGAQFVQTAASAIGVLYTGVLAVIFVSDTPVPVRGFLPTLFFALAIGFATAYLAFVGKIPAMPRPTRWGSVPEDIWQRTNFVARYARAIVLQRAPLLRAGVISLVFGVILLPAAVLRLPHAAANVSPPTPAVIAWPAPPTMMPERLALALYKVQLDRFVDELDKPAPAQGTIEDIVVLLVTLFGLLVVGGAATKKLWDDKPDSADPHAKTGDVVVSPSLK